MRKKRKQPLHWKILIGMILGISFSVLMSNFEWGKDFVINWIKPFGNMFINALKLIAVPLIFCSLVTGISNLGDISKLSKMGFRTIAVYIFSTLVAVTIALFVVNLIKPGNYITESTREELVSGYGIETTYNMKQANSLVNKGPLEALEKIIPNNFFKAASDNGSMLQVIFFALFFGIGVILIPKKKAKSVKKFFDGTNDVILKLIDIIMLSAPYGVFALLATLVIESPSTDLFVALGMYAMSVLMGLIIMMLLYAMIVRLYTGTKVLSFFRALSPAQLLAFSTSSSAATLPVTMRQVEKKLGVEEDVASFVLPIGATINMDGTSLYQAVAAVFIAQAFGMDLDFQTQLGIIATATLASIGSAAVPGAGMVMLVIVLAQAGIPEIGLALIFAVDRPLDMCRTAVNVTGDASTSMIIAKSLNKISVPKIK